MQIEAKYAKNSTFISIFDSIYMAKYLLSGRRKEKLYAIITNVFNRKIQRNPKLSANPEKI